MYELRFAQDVAKALEKLTAKEQERIKAALRVLAEEPRGANTRKLRGSELYRYRTGKYRIIYGVRDDKLLVIMLDVMHRGEDYQSLETLVRRWRSLL
ncbi:MAG: type II toxin-antitoxin system RelE/ParE family toxin [Trueperaceae bacterium]